MIMSKSYKQQPNVGNATRFSKSPMAEVEFSRMVATPTWLIPFNGGDIVPVYYSEVLPHSTFSLDTDFIIREMTKLRPVMGEMIVDIYPFFVPNRIINESWKNVQGENTSGVWTAPEVQLAPLYKTTSNGLVQIPVGSLADYYGFPTQRPIPGSVLEQCNDLKFRGYLEIYNNWFRSENYMPPIPYSKLNVYNGFLNRKGSYLFFDGTDSGNLTIEAGQASDGSYPAGAVVESLYGQGSQNTADFPVAPRLTAFSALDKPLKACKLHDYFTSVLPAPQKGPEVYFGLADVAGLNTQENTYEFDNPIKLQFDSTATPISVGALMSLFGSSANAGGVTTGTLASIGSAEFPVSDINTVTGSNVYVDLSQATGVSINDLRTAIATQQVYETLARGGSRYVSMLASFFELDTESPFPDMPVKLGHIRETLDLYQVAQTSATNEESPQGTLSAYGYTNGNGHLFTRTFIEHGYVHVLAVVRQKNVYSTYFAPDNFRRTTMDFYLPQLANISEQPVRLAQLNPFRSDSMELALGFQEAWNEYRYEPDRTVGEFRSGVPGSLDVWTYADDFDPDFTYIDGNWLRSNAEEVLNRTIAVTSDIAPQFKGQFVFRVDKQLPMPTYSIPGLDTL